MTSQELNLLKYPLTFHLGRGIIKSYKSVDWWVFFWQKELDRMNKEVTV